MTDAGPDWDWRPFYRPVVVSDEMRGDFLDGDQVIRNAINKATREAVLDWRNPRHGPRRVLNDTQQAELDRRQALADVLLDIALEWGVLDLVDHDGDEWR